MHADVLYVGVRGGGGETVATMDAGGSRVARDARQEPSGLFVSGMQLDLGVSEPVGDRSSLFC